MKKITQKFLPTMVADLFAEHMADSLNRSLFMSDMIFGKVIGYRWKKEPRYLYLPIPVIEKHYDSDYEYGSGEFEGLLISVVWKRLFRIGSKRVKVPIYSKKQTTGESINIPKIESLKSEKSNQPKP